MIRRLYNSVLESAIISQMKPVALSHPFSQPELFQLDWLTAVAPCFPVDSASVTVLSEPSQFYDNLMEYSARALHRITLASLYIGTGDLERRLIDRICENPALKLGALRVSVLLDYNRGSRGKLNSRSMLMPLLEEYEQSCTFCLYRTPSLRGLLKRLIPDRWNELIGLQHMKIYIFDDTVLFSGANLSNDYFTNRQDRYVIVKDKDLADFYDGLVEQVQKFSINIDKTDQESFNAAFSGLSVDQYRRRAGATVLEYISEAKEAVRERKADTWIFPLVQMGEFGISQDSTATSRLLGEAKCDAKIYMATGYFNLPDDYASTLLEHTRGFCELLMAHPSANGFLGAAGPAGGIPAAYSLLARRFYRQIEQKQVQDRLRLREYSRSGWTYHAKGLWYYPGGCLEPALTFVGSPNFGARSVERDLESQVAVVTENGQLRKRLHAECKQLLRYSAVAEVERPVPLWVHLVVFLFRDFF